MSSSNPHSSALSTPAWLRTDGATDNDAGEGLRDDVAGLFVAHRQEIHRYLAHMLCPGIEAEELTQEVFLRLYRERLAGRRVSAPRAWLFTVARNMAIDHVRRTRQQMRLIDRSSADMADYVADAAPNGEEALLSESRRTALAGALGELTDVQRECLHLRAHGLSLREIGAIVGLSVAGASDAIRRAIKRIQKEIDGHA
jgi:RNA polymerase sigma-70 factor (ECF subfamily)